MIRRIAVFVLFLALGATPAAASDDLFSFPAVETHTIISDVTGQTYEIRVMVPVSKTDESEKFPVLYMTDANGQIPFGQHTRYMQAAGEIPRFIIVGIGYPEKDLFGALYLRQRDLTPTELERPGYGVPIVGLKEIEVGKKSGGGPEFLKFIREQLKPFINENYDTIRGGDAYFGHSLGGLFGLYVLFNEPETFNRYVLGSPAVWWDNEVIFQHAQRFLEQSEAVDAKVYMAVGGAEEAARPDQHYVSGFYRMEALLRSKPIADFSLTAEVFPGVAHVSALGMVHARGLRSVYGPAKCSPFKLGGCD